jgi:hypothetical protein
MCSSVGRPQSDHLCGRLRREGPSLSRRRLRLRMGHELVFSQQSPPRLYFRVPTLLLKLNKLLGPRPWREARTEHCPQQAAGRALRPTTPG